MRCHQLCVVSGGRTSHMKGLEDVTYEGVGGRHL